MVCPRIAPLNIRHRAAPSTMPLRTQLAFCLTTQGRLEGLAALRLAILEEIKEALADPLDSLQEFIDANGFAS